MKKLATRFLALGLFMMSSAIFVNAPASAQLPIQYCAVPKTEGDKVPFPRRIANEKFELAEAENYLLSGYIVNIQNHPYFQIDFVSQPWLATQNRIRYPYFPIYTNDAGMVQRYNGARVVMAVIPHKLAAGTSPDFSSGLVLEMIVPPQVEKF